MALHEPWNGMGGRRCAAGRVAVWLAFAPIPGQLRLRCTSVPHAAGIPGSIDFAIDSMQGACLSSPDLSSVRCCLPWIQHIGDLPASFSKVLQDSLECQLEWKDEARAKPQKHVYSTVVACGGKREAHPPSCMPLLSVRARVLTHLLALLSTDVLIHGSPDSLVLPIQSTRVLLSGLWIHSYMGPSCSRPLRCKPVIRMSWEEIQFNLYLFCLYIHSFFFCQNCLYRRISS